MEALRTDPVTGGPEKKSSRMVMAAILPALAVILLWCIYFVDETFQLELSNYAVLPRHTKGLVGILVAPLLHDHSDHLQHLWNNSIAVFMLGWSLMYFYPRKAGSVIAFVWLFGGACVWLMGRENYHLGASGVVYGMAAFLFMSGLLRKQRTLMALSLLVVFLYGSLLWGIFPLVPHISWESHLWGLVSGIFIAYFYRDVEPAVQDPVSITFDDEDENELGEIENLNLPQAGLPGIRVIYRTPGLDPQQQEMDPRQGPYDPNRTSSTGPVDGLQ
ncbi:MAG: rhomboid family intramembrane serine protease [Flavobacteriales bacterium]|nr:rhomboid family intramembrane serine protease [Flavobacteriales bacterium]MBK7239342.1 rhomboid family intramembrane serine protease [Flavobacteriales bacterium]MBK9535453.1 rhomboid family intramembrane serine protease [Flavobacteriales bacterium]HQV53829.1 rhomboid family intramembrane serine protease [Flavobacteriales bacterium]HQX31668.1 rhomboid family intramembrane serine protease [Flavobacteriales bacterium]